MVLIDTFEPRCVSRGKAANLSEDAVPYRAQAIPNYKSDQSGSLSSLFSIPILGCAFSIIVSPLILFFTSTAQSVAGVMETRYENKIFWPVMTLLAFISVGRNASRLDKVVLPANILCLLAYLLFAGLSILWAFAPEQSLVRYIQQVMVVVSIVVPGILAGRSVDLIRGLFLCLAIAVVLNVFFLIGGYQTIADGIAIGYSGYFLGKNYLGECAAITLLVSFHELFYRGTRRVAGIAIVIICVVLLYFSNSKTALGLALLAPMVAGSMLIIRRATGASPAAIAWLAILGYLMLSKVTGFNMGRVSFMLYGDSSFTGRQVIWDFASLEITKYPLFGWGYQSFWLVGPTGPSVIDAPGWVKFMPNAHNGYYDATLEMGYVGLALLATFLTATLQSIGRLIDRNPPRGWIILSITIYILIHNGLETTWMRGFEFMWVVFLIITADIAKNYNAERLIGRSRQQLFSRRSRTVRATAGRQPRAIGVPTAANINCRGARQGEKV